MWKLEQTLGSTDIRRTRAGTQVHEQLVKITEELGITKKPVVAPELFAQYGVFDAEISTYLNEAMVVEALEQLADELNRDMQSFIGNQFLFHLFINPK